MLPSLTGKALGSSFELMVQDLGVQSRGSENLSIICVELQHLDPLASRVLVAQRNQCFRGKGLSLQLPGRDV